jgi:hypothetical protein
MAKLLRLEGKVNSGLINALDMFTQKSFKPDLPRLCLRQFIDTPGGCYGDNSFTESDNSALKRDVCGPKPNNKLHIALDATITHTNKRFKKLDMDAHKLIGQTSLCSGVVSAEYHKLSNTMQYVRLLSWVKPLLATLVPLITLLIFSPRCCMVRHATSWWADSCTMCFRTRPKPRPIS